MKPCISAFRNAALISAGLLALLLATPHAAHAQVDVTTLGLGALYNNIGSYNTGVGSYALNNSNSGNYNSAFGALALNLNTTGSYNSALGYSALGNNSSGTSNTALGDYALYYNTTGTSNTASGFDALYANTTGYYNTASGSNALRANTTGFDNTASGYLALFYNTTGAENSAFGAQALYSNTTGNDNTASGHLALNGNTTGNYNTASGFAALDANTTGYYNTASGAEALLNNTSGYENTGLGYQALNANAVGVYNLALGYQAGMNITKSENIDIANAGTAGDNGVIRIGTAGTHTAAYIAGINGVASPKGIAVFINSQGQLGTFTSSRRYKKNIQALGDLSSKLMALRPVSFRYKQAAEDGTYPLQYGLIAEEVAKVSPELVAYDRAGKPYSVNYHLLTPLLLNQLQREHRQAVAQKSEIAAIKATHNAEIAALKSELASLKLAHEQEMRLLARLEAAAPAGGKPQATQTAFAPR